MRSPKGPSNLPAFQPFPRPSSLPTFPPSSLRQPLSLAFALIFLALACHKPDPREEARKSITSWRCTVALLATSWVERDIPDVYAKLAAEKAAENLGKLGSHDAAMARALKEAVEHHDRARAAAIALELQRKP